MMNFTIRANVLIIILLCATMFSRVATSLGAPKILVHAHYAICILIFFVLVISLNMRNELRKFIFPLIALFVSVTLSAIVNGAGLINVLLEFVLLIEPILLFLMIALVVWSHKSIERFRHFLVVIVVVHSSFSYVQFFILGLIDDDVKGLFLAMGAGHHVAGAVALTAAIHYLTNRNISLLSAKISLFCLLSPIVFFSDAKQVVAVFLVSLIVFITLKITDFKRVAQLSLVLIVSIVSLVWLAISIVPSLAVWAEWGLIAEGISQKLSVFPIIISHYEVPLNWAFGLGPGHTVGRLGWMLPDYQDYLLPLGATMSGVTDAVWAANQEHYISNSTTGSSMFSLLFSWVGFWGDLGIVGVMIYIYLLLLIFRMIRMDNTSAFLLITVAVFGVIFSWMEEPGYMLFVFAILGIRYQEALTIARTKIAK